jgi:peptidoglycan hydrolase-like protein with peptidoglycan-binding domain
MDMGIKITKAQLRSVITEEIARILERGIARGGYPAGRATVAPQMSPEAINKQIVKNVQTVLNTNHGASLAVDGIVGPKTRAAYKSIVGTDMPADPQAALVGIQFPESRRLAGGPENPLEPGSLAGTPAGRMQTFTGATANVPKSKTPPTGLPAPGSAASLIVPPPRTGPPQPNPIDMGGGFQGEEDALAPELTGREKRKTKRAARKMKRQQRRGLEENIRRIAKEILNDLI